MPTVLMITGPRSHRIGVIDHVHTEHGLGDDKTVCKLLIAPILEYSPQIIHWRYKSHLSGAETKWSPKDNVKNIPLGDKKRDETTNGKFKNLTEKPTKPKFSSPPR
jgi:hypothetical protein